MCPGSGSASMITGPLGLPDEKEGWVNLAIFNDRRRSRRAASPSSAASTLAKISSGASSVTGSAAERETLGLRISLRRAGGAEEVSRDRGGVDRRMALTRCDKSSTVCARSRIAASTLRTDRCTRSRIG